MDNIQFENLVQALVYRVREQEIVDPKGLLYPVALADTKAAYEAVLKAFDEKAGL